MKIIRREADLPVYNRQVSRSKALDILDDRYEVVVRTKLPISIREEDVDVQVSGNMLTITAERQMRDERVDRGWQIRRVGYGKILRSTWLPTDVSVEDAHAVLDNGMLTIRLPKTDTLPGEIADVKSIPVRASHTMKKVASRIRRWIRRPQE